MASPLSLLSFLFPLYIPLYTSFLFWAPSELRSKLRSQADKTGIELLLRSCMRPSLTKSKSGSHLCLSLSSPLPFSLVSFSNNKVLPASFGQIPEPWAVSWTLGGLLWPGCLPLWFFPPSFLFFLRLLFCFGVLLLSLSELRSCLPARFRTGDTCGPLVWSWKRRGLLDLSCLSTLEQVYGVCLDNVGPCVKLRPIAGPYV